MDNVKSAEGYRALTCEEIERLETRQFCECSDWGRVKVHPEFRPESARRVKFSGDILLGKFEKKFKLPGGVEVEAGISDATLHDCSIGDNACVRKVAGYIAGYDIGPEARIENAQGLICTGDSSFGIATDVSVLNETGGREVPIHERLSAQIAWMVAMYRHKADVAHRIGEMIRVDAQRLRGTRGKIGKGAVVINTGEILNVNIGPGAVINGASKLIDGTIASTELSPVHIGVGVIAEHFVVLAGAKVEDAVVMVNTFVGQACHLSHLFSAHDSLFFANCVCENGEAAAIFAGPYTVTMHKSSLLIAGLFSFLNAGSGSNQSNHGYKLGPIHQGVVERGSKTTSDSYILWPARVGAFSLVMGRHVNHPDTSLLPFSYLIENHGLSYLVPGVNIKSVGTIRDAQKWPKRDKRHRDEHRLDQINFNLLSPYTARKMLLGIKLLDKIEITEGPSSTHFSYCGMTIEARALRKGRDYYRIALDKFFGNSLISRLKGLNNPTIEEVHRLLTPTHMAGAGQWLDIAGMFVPKTEIELICDDISSNRIKSINELQERFASLSADYYDMEWTWVAENFKAWAGKEVSELTFEDINVLINRWEKSVLALNAMLHEDARKEFSLTSTIGFGADGHDETRTEDFKNVRGEFESDAFVMMVHKHSADKSALAAEIRQQLNLH